MKIYLEKLFNEYEWETLDNHINRLNNSPGVYILTKPLKSKPKNFNIKEIFYVGKSNSKDGVKNRLKQFRSGVEKSRGHHSAGNRFYNEYCKGKAFSRTKEFKGKFFL